MMKPILWIAVHLVMYASVPAQGSCENLPVGYGKDLLAAFAMSWTSPIRIRYRTSYGADDSRSVSDWLIRGRLGEWDSRRIKRDAEQRPVSVRIERGDLIYDVARSKTGWIATVNRRDGAMTFDSLCPLQRYVSLVAGKPWPDAMHDHAPIEVWRTRRGDGTFLVLRMPLLPDYLSVIQKGGVIRNFLCWEVWMQRDGGTLLVRRALGLASAQVSDVGGPPGALIDNDRAIACDPVRPWIGDMACVVVQRLEFGQFQTIGGRAVPGTMTIETAEGVSHSELGRLIDLTEPVPDSDFAFRAPAEFGVVGQLHDARSRKTVYYGEWPGKETKVLNALIDNGDLLYRRQRSSFGWTNYAAFAASLIAGACVVWMRGGRNHGRHGHDLPDRTAISQ